MKFLALAMIRLYQLLLAPFLGGRCRFEPSCSVYATEAFQKHGGLKAFVLTLKRILKCHPLGPSGYDPVPQPDTEEDKIPT